VRGENAVRRHWLHNVAAVHRPGHERLK
jgi:hypothetical protein